MWTCSNAHANGSKIARRGYAMQISGITLRESTPFGTKKTERYFGGVERITSVGGFFVCLLFLCVTE